MRRVRGLTDATKRLRGFGLAVIAMLTTAGLALVGFSGAQSAADGSDSKIDFAASISSNSLGSSDANLRAGSQFTFQAWVRPNSMATTTDHVMAVRHYDFAVVVYANTWRYYFGVNSAWSAQQNTGVVVRPGEWVHVALVQNGTTSTFFIDGQPVHTSTGRTSPPANSTAKFRLGSWTDSGGVFSGLIDEVRVWGSDRTANLVTDMHNRPTPGASGLRAYWDFNHGSGSLIYDRVASRNLTALTAPSYSDVKSSTAASDGDTVITFPRTYLPGVGGWTVPQNATDFRALVVGGGGGGGASGDSPGAGGGGAGGFRETVDLPAPGTVATLRVGQGGLGGPDDRRWLEGKNGQDSEIAATIAEGGGAGGGRNTSGFNGGSGGGAGGRTGANQLNSGGAGVAGQGFSGGSTTDLKNSIAFRPGAGGGGAGGQGASVMSGQTQGGAGGAGSTSAIASGTFAAGGAGGDSFSTNDGAHGPANTGNGGGGGGGASGSQAGGNGGSGVVIVRYTNSVDTALGLTAASNHLSATSGLIPAVYTFEAWIRPTSFDGSPVIYSQGGANGDSALWINGSGNPQVEWGGSSAANITSYKFPLNEWTHVAVSKDGSRVPRLYINSRLIWTGGANSGTFAGQFKIGQWWAHSNNNFIGEIDQVKIWSTTLGESALLASMHTYSTSGVVGHTLHAHYDMNDSEQELELDRSGNGRHLTKVSLTSAFYSSSNIVETGPAHTEQNYVKFKRSYLTATGGWTPTTNASRYKALVVGGGGAGGWALNSSAGGGGGGEVVYSEQVTASGIVSIRVAQGGLATSSFIRVGQASVVSTPSGVSISARGGGTGAAYDNVTGATVTTVAATGAPQFTGGGGAAQFPVVAPAAGAGFTGGAALGGGVVDAQAGGGGAGAGGDGVAATAGTQGNGGPGVASSILGSSQSFGVGGQGGKRTSSGTPPSPSVGAAGGRNSIGSSAGSNTGGGGGGAGNTTGTPRTSGGSGGSGVIILSWGPYLEISQSPTVARAGEEFREALKLRVIDPEDGEPFTGSYPVTVIASANVLTLNGVPLTQPYTVQSSADRTVDFSGLGFALNVAGDVTLTFTSDQFVGTSVVVTPSYYPQDVEIVSSGTTGGQFFEGEFFASSSAATTTITKDDLVAHLASYSTVISASGYISVNTTVTSASASDLVLRAGGHINVTASAIIRTHGGDIVLWADSDQSAGGEVRLLGGAQLCTAPAGATCGTATTGGGDIVIGGGLADPNDPNRPAGYAAGSGDIYASDGTATTTGVQLGNINSGGTGPKIYSAGGDIAIRGAVTSVSTTNWRAGIAVVGGTVIRSGEGKILLSADASAYVAHSGTSGTIEFNAWGSNPGVNVEIESLSTDPEAIVVEGIEGNDITARGVWGSNDNTEIVSAGGFVIRANQINSNLDLHLSVSGQVVIEPHTTSLRNSSDLTSAFSSPLRNTDVNDKLWLRSPPAGIRIGSPSNSNQVILNSSFTSAGDIEIIGGSIDVNSHPQIISTAPGAKVLLKASNWIDFRAGTSSTTHGKIQTNNGDIIFWSDSDGDGAGSINLGAHSVLNSANGVESKTASGGGRITFAGGDDGVDSQGHPLGFAGDFGPFNGTNNYWSILIQVSKIFSGGGDVTFRSRSDYGLLDTMRIDGGAQVWSGTGRIYADVRKVGDGNTFFMYQNSWVSAATTSPAIEINAQSTGTGGVFDALSNGTSLVALGSGGISITTTTSNTALNAITMVGMDLLSREGEIEVSTNGRFSWATNAARSIGSKATGDVTTSSADVRIVAQGFIDSTANVQSKISTFGVVRILPAGTNFGVESSLNFDVEAGSFQFGSVDALGTANKSLTIARSIDATDDIVLAENTVTVQANATLKSSSSSGSIEILSNAAASLNSTITGQGEVLVRSGSLAFNSASIIGTANVTLESQGTSYTTAPTSFNGLTLGTNLSGLTIGKASETGTITLNRAFTISGPITVHAGTINLQAAQEVTSASARVTLKSKGDIITTAAGDITTDGGAIVLWSNSDGDSSSGGRIQVVTNSALISNGGDIVLAGGSQQDSSGYPSGYVKSAPNSGLSALRFEGSANSAGGDVIFRGESAESDAIGRGNTAGVYVEPESSITSGAGDISISGRVPSGNLNTGNQWGLWVGDGDGLATIKSTTGNIYMSGDASALRNGNNGGGFVAYQANVTSQTGDVVLSGAMGQKTSNPYTAALVDITGWSTFRFTVSTSGDVSVLGSTAGVVDLRGLKVVNSNRLEIHAQTLRSNWTSNLRANDLIVREPNGSTPGTAVLNLPSNVNIASSTGNVFLGRSGVGQLSLVSKVSVSGNVSIQATNVSISADIDAGGSTPAITISADVLDVDDVKSIKAIGGDVTLLANTAARGIMLGGITTSALLEISDTELGTVSATNLRIGDPSTANVYIAGDITLDSQKVTNLVIQAAGNVLAQSGAKITAANLAIQAGGIIDLVGENSVGGNVALNGSGGVSYSSAVSYSPATVSGFTPVFGVGIAVSQTNSPAVQNRNAFLAVTFNPPPQFVVTDSYSNELDSNNRLAASYTVSATASASGTLGSVTGLTSSFSAGVYSFNSLKVLTDPGTYSFNVTVDDGGAGFTTSSVLYNVQSGDPQQLIVTANEDSSPSGQASFSFVVSVQDQGGNTIVAGTNKNITVSASVSGGVLVSGGQAQANDSGVAVFTELIVTGSVSSQISISFFVEFTNNDNVFTTVSSAVLPITLTPGTPTQLRIDDPSQSVANRTTMSALVIDLLDAQGNTVATRSDVISVSITSGSNATLVGTTSLNFSVAGAAQLTFDNLALQGTVGDFTLDFVSEQPDIASASHAVTLTHGVATQLAITQGAAQIRSGIQIVTQPRLALRDLDGNLVPSDASVSATVQGATLGGSAVIEMVDGRATYSDLVLTGTAGSYTISYSISAPVALAEFSISEPITITAGAPAKLRVAQHPGDVVAGVAQAVSVSVQVLDAQDNLTTVTAPTEINLSLQNYAGGAAIVETTSPITLTPGNSTLTYSNLIFTKAGPTMRLQFTASGLTDATSNFFSITANAPHHLEWVTNVSEVANDVVMSPAPTLRVFDAFDNPVVTSSAQTSISVSVIVGGANVLNLSGGTSQTDSSSSLVSLDNLVLRATVGSYQLRITALNSGQPIDGFTIDSNNFDVVFGDAVSLTTSPKALSVMNRATLAEITVSVLDTAGNLVADNTQSITPSVSGIALTGTAVSAVGGQATFSSLVLTGLVGSYDLGFSAAGVTGATTSVTVSHAAPSALSFSAPATAQNAATTSELIAELLDQDGNRVISGDQSEQTVELTVVGAALSGDVRVSASAGIATFSNVAITGSISDKVITATILDPSEITASETVSLSFGVASKLAITTPAAGFVNRTNFTTQPRVTVQDISGNTVENFSGSVTLNIGSGASFNYAEPAGVEAARLASCTPSVSGGLQYTVALVGSDCVISFTSGSGSWTPNFDGSLQLLAVAGGGGGGAGRGQDQIPGGGGGAGELLFSSSRNVSQAAVSIQIGQGGANAVGDFENGGTGGNTTFGSTTLRGGGFGSGANNGSGAGSGGSGGGGSGFNKSRFGGASNASVGLGFPGGSNPIGDSAAAGGGGAGGPGLPRSGQQGGAGGPGLEFDISGQLVTYAVGGKGGSHNLAGQGRPTSNSSIGGGGGGRAGYNSESTAGQPGIVIVRFPSSVPAAVNVNSQGGVSVTPVNGVATFTNLGLRGTVGDYIITASATSLVSASQDVTLTHGVATQLELTSPATVINDTNFSTQPSLRLLDADGNLVSTSASASGQVVVSYTGSDWTNDGTGVDLSGTTTLTLSQGQGSFSDLRLSGKVGSYTLTYSYQPDTSISTSGAVTVEPGTESSIAIVQQPQNVIAGVAFASDVVVEILDSYQNRVTRLTESATVRARLINSSDSAFVTFSSAVGSQQGLVTFSALTFTSAGDRKIIFEGAPGSSASALATVTSVPFTITHAAASTLSWVVLPQGSVANDATLTGVGGSPQIRAFDEFGNLANTGTVSVEVVSVGPNTPQAIAGAEVDGVTGTITLTQLSLRALVGLYDLEFRATTDTNASVFATLSHQVEILHGVPTQVTTSAHATAARAGINFTPQPVIEILDSAGNLVSNSSLVVYAAASGANLVGTSQLAATNGVSTFSGLQLTGSASSAVTLSYEISYQSSSISTSVVIPLLAGDTAMAALSWTVTDVQTRVAPQNTPLVELFDSFGNKALSDSGSTAVARLYKAGALVTQSPTTFTAASGEISFAGLALKATPGSNYSYELEVGGLAPVTSSNFSMLPGPVAKVVIHKQPRTITGGVTTTMTGELFEDNAVVRLFDIDDNLVHTVDSGVITAAITSGTGGTLISASASITNGSATFNELRLVGAVETPEQSAQEYKLTFSYGGFSSSESDVLKVKHNVATKLDLVQNADGGRASSVFTTQPKVRLLDRYDNWVSTGTNVTVQADVIDENGVGSPTIVGGDAQTNNGEATLAIGISGTTATSYTLRFVATTNPDGPIASAEQTGITITHGSASRVKILRELSSDDGSGNLTKTGSALNVQPVVEVVDANDNRVLDFTGMIRASLSATVRAERDFLISNTVSAVAGVATFSGLALVGEVGTNYRINFFRDGFVGNSAESVDFALTHGNAEYLTIETQPEGGNKTGSALSQSPTIAVRDFDGNITTTLNGSSVSAAVFSGGGSVDTSGSNSDRALVVNGIAQFSNLTVVALPGVDQSLVFTLDGAQNSASGLVTSSASVTFSMITSDAFQLSVFTEPCTAADCSAGPTAELLGVQPVVEVQDRFGNRVEGFTGLVKATLQGTGGSLRDADGQISSRSVAVVNGFATFTDLRIEGVPGNNYSLQFETSGLQSTTSQDVQVIHTTPSQLVITQQPVGGVTGDVLASQPVVEVRDRFNNLAVTDNSSQVSVRVFSGPERLSELPAEITGSLTVTAVNGVATFAGLELFAKTGENYVLEFATAGFDVLSNGVVVSPAGANRFEWVVEPVAQRTGEAMGTQPVLRMLDFDGNIASSTAATVVASVTSGGGYIEAGTTSSAVEGIVTFAGLTLVAAPNTPQTLTFTATTASGSFSITTVTPLNVQHTAASNMSIDAGYATSNEQGVVLGTQPVVKLYDRFGNLAVNDNSTVVSATIGSGVGGAVSGATTATAVGGVVTFAGLAVTGSPGVDYTLDFSAGGYGVSGTAQLRVFKTAALELSYSNIVYSSSPTTSPAIAFTDSTEHSISFSVSTPQFCTINATSGEVSIVGAGTCVIQASVADGTYYKATSKDVTLTIDKAQQDPVVIANNAFVNFGEALTLTATGGSSTKPTRFFANGECQILGDKLVTFGNATEGGDASCTIIASRGGDANYLSSTAAEMDIEIRRIAQQPISIGNNRNVSVGDVNLFIVGGSGNGTISYTVQGGTNNAQCSVTNGVLTADRNGSCEVSAQKALSANYNTASSPVVMFTFTKQLQQIEITSAPPAMPLPGQSYQVAATTSSGLNISYSVTKGAEIPETSTTSFSPAVCALSQSVSGSVTFLRSGECEITATAPSSDRFASGTAKISILIGQLNQFITFNAISDKNYGAPSFRLQAEASSGLAVSFTVSSGVNVCSISNNRVTIDSAGTCEIRASQAGNGSYAPAPNVFRSFVVSPGAASAPALVSAAVGNQWFTVGFTAPSYDGGSSIMAYRLEVRDQNDNLYVTTTTNTQSPLSITAVGIPNNTPYTAKVAAITSAGIGQFSNTSVPLTPSDAAMSVTQLSADTSTTGLDLSWITPEAIQGSFQRYEIYAWVTGSEEPTSPTTTLTNSASDQVSIDVSSISSAVSVSPASFTAPRLEIIQPLFQPMKGVHIFGASKTKPMGFISLASISQPSTASATVGYTMRVVTITDTASSSQVINTANGVKVGLSTPSAPTQLNLDTSDPTRIVATWAAPNSDGGFALQDYQVTSNGQVICANIQVRMCEISPLSESTTYNIEVKARNALGMGEAAGGSHTTPTPEPVITVQSQESVERVTLGPIPQMLNFVPSVVRPGAMVSVTGERLNTLESISIGGIQVEFAIQDAGALMFRIPIDMPSGRYSVIHTSTFGKVTVMDAITVLEMRVEEENEPVEAPETEVPLNPEATTPEAPVSPESGSQAPNSGGVASDGLGTSTEQPVEPETQVPEPSPTQTSEPTPTHSETRDSESAASPDPDDEIIAAGPRDQQPLAEFSLSLALIVATLLGLLVLRLRKERSAQQ